MVQGDAPEISDLVIDFDPVTLARRGIRKADVLARLAHPAARRVVESIPEAGDQLDDVAVDQMLYRSHLELQRLHEEFKVGDAMRRYLVPMIDLVRRRAGVRRVRVVDLGSGLGYILRWLAARGDLVEVDLVGADYNASLVSAAQRLADMEGLPCRFVVGNAFELEEPAHVVISTGVMHHFRGDGLAQVFAQHAKSGVHAFVHMDIRPSPVAPVGAWIFHQARMREPLARFDGYWSAVRAHSAAAMRAAIAVGAPAYTTATLDAHFNLAGLFRIFQAVVGVRGIEPAALREVYAPFGGRFQA